MNKRKEYITNPARICAFIVFVFGLGVTYATLISRINKLEEFQQTVNILEIQKDIQEIKTNVAWLTKIMSDYIK